MEMLLNNRRHSRKLRRNQNDNILQNLTNVVVSNIVTKPLEGGTTSHCRLVHDLEDMYTK